MNQPPHTLTSHNVVPPADAPSARIRALISYDVIKQSYSYALPASPSIINVFSCHVRITSMYRFVEQHLDMV
eukprot:19080-Heterococcus_DN1.PRE.2